VPRPSSRSVRLDAAIGDFGWVSATDVVSSVVFYSAYLWTATQLVR
jgi:hypothetical protein